VKRSHKVENLFFPETIVLTCTSRGLFCQVGRCR
jgi:hypothetical protein